MEMVVGKEVVVRGVEATPNVLAVAGMFGIGIGHEETIQIVEPTRLNISAGQVILITGPSGSGKSTLLHCIRDHLPPADLWPLDARIPPDLADRAHVDCFLPRPHPEVLACLARAGLSDAFVLLRRPVELSEGQRFRFQLARFFASDCPILLADEFAATLDSATARIVAFGLQKRLAGTRLAAVLVTPRTDLAPDLRPIAIVRLR